MSKVLKFLPTNIFHSDLKGIDIYMQRHGKAGRSSKVFNVTKLDSVHVGFEVSKHCLTFFLTHFKTIRFDEG